MPEVSHAPVSPGKQPAAVPASGPWFTSTHVVPEHELAPGVSNRHTLLPVPVGEARRRRHAGARLADALGDAVELALHAELAAVEGVRPAGALRARGTLDVAVADGRGIAGLADGDAA